MKKSFRVVCITVVVGCLFCFSLPVFAKAADDGSWLGVAGTSVDNNKFTRDDLIKKINSISDLLNGENSKDKDTLMALLADNEKTVFQNLIYMNDAVEWQSLKTAFRNIFSLEVDDLAKGWVIRDFWNNGNKVFLTASYDISDFLGSSGNPVKEGVHQYSVGCWAFEGKGENLLFKRSMTIPALGEDDLKAALNEAKQGCASFLPIVRAMDGLKMNRVALSYATQRPFKLFLNGYLVSWSEGGEVYDNSIGINVPIVDGRNNLVIRLGKLNNRVVSVLKKGVNMMSMFGDKKDVVFNLKISLVGDNKTLIELRNQKSDQNVNVGFSFNFNSRNLTKSLSQAHNTQRKNDVKKLLDAVSEHLIDSHGLLPSSVGTNAVLVGSGSGKADLCSLLVPIYLLAMPFDPTATGAHYTSCSDYETGYTISRISSGSITVSAPNAESGEVISATR